MESTMPVVESFHSLQGEGAHTGQSAFFIRLGGCKVGCTWCDTKSSWPINNHPQVSINKLSEEAEIARCNGAVFVVITGGEPLHHDLNALCEAIRKATMNHQTKPMPIHLETSGVNKITGHPNWITLSPKRHAPPLKEVLTACQELKVVIHETADLIFAEKMADYIVNSKRQRNNNKSLLFLQPGWNSQEGKKITYEYVKRHPKWKLSIQTHKWLGVL